MIVRQKGLPDLRHSHGLRINSNMDLDLEDKATTPQLDLRLRLLEAWPLFPLPVRLLNRPNTLTKLDHPLNRDILNKPCNSNNSSSNTLTNKIRLQVNRTTTMLQD
ncbi:hypothetical protein BGZ74_007191 [Mortierella antarctica]|nr:hypothetical protein BGZ74_007191 [Mortierella antarctica]